MMYALAKAMQAERESEVARETRLRVLLRSEQCAECSSEHESHLRSRGMAWFLRGSRSAA